MKLLRNKVLLLSLLAGTGLLIWVLFNTRWIWRNYLLPPPVNFRENRDISLDLYPEGHRSASVFINEAGSGSVRPWLMENLRQRLRNQNILATILVDPSPPGSGILTADLSQALELRRFRNYGFEIAQAGYPPEVPIPGSQLAARWREDILADRAILTELGFEISGYRVLGQNQGGTVAPVLDRLGYLYAVDQSFPARTLRSLFRPGFRGDIYFPYHSAGRDLLEVVWHAEPLARPEKARQRFREVHRRRGVFIFKTSFGDFDSPGSLDRLKRFIRYLKRQDTWICPLGELCQWWQAREKISIVTVRDDDGNLDIQYRNQTPFMMKNARIHFKSGKSPARTYRIRNTRGDIVAAGLIPDSRSLLVTFPPEPAVESSR